MGTSVVEPDFSIGIEEEFLLVDRRTRDLASDPPEDLLKDCERELGSRVSAEFLKSQIEIGTKVCHSIAEARRELKQLRGRVAAIADRYGLAPIAASTHPFAQWTEQRHTDKARYNEIARSLRVVARRMVICGMHVHVGIEDEDLRIDILNQASYFLPHLLALSTSSPFWQGEVTGLKSYRALVTKDLPRAGLPQQFASFREYQRTVDVLVQANLIEDATKVWWDLRPSARFPTLEMRITDVCPLLEDAVSIAALFVCICRMLYRLRLSNQRWRHYPAFLINENRWLAQRDGISEGLVDFGRGEIVSFAVLLDELIELVHEDAVFFDCVAEIERLRGILVHGTSADRQLACFHAAQGETGGAYAALQKVVDQLIAETVEGVEG